MDGFADTVLALFRVVILLGNLAFMFYHFDRLDKVLDAEGPGRVVAARLVLALVFLFTTGWAVANLYS